MLWTRILFVMFLSVALLPWGAYAGTALSHRGSPATVTSAIPDTAHVAVVVKRPCRGPALPGGPCATDVILPPAPGMEQQAVRASFGLLPQMRMTTAVTPDRLKRPPRTI